MQKSIFWWPLKAFIAMCLAFVILNLLACIYRGGLPGVADRTMAAPLHYVPNTYFSDMREGISIGVYDENGFNNAYPAKDAIDYLVLGSSQMEAKQVMPDRNTVYRLNELLNSGGVGYAYNIGISGERLTACIQRLRCAIDTYRPQKAVLLETGSVDFSEEEIEEALEEVQVGGLLHSYSNGIMGFVRTLPFVRLAYIQIQQMAGGENADEDMDGKSMTAASGDRTEYAGKITPLIEKAAENAGGVPVIIFYHPSITIHYDGSISTNGDSEMSRLFGEICSSCGVGYIDLSERFMREYEKGHVLPYGFANTSVGTGHLNKYGHAMIADELYQRISGAE